MLVAQVLSSAFLWLCLAVWLAMRFRKPVEPVGPTPVGSALRGALLMLASVAVLAAGLLSAQGVGGWSGGRLAYGSWAIVTGTGLAFVYLQALAALQIVRHAHRAVTSGRPSPSQEQIPEETDA